MDKKLLTAMVFHNLRVLNKVTPRDTYVLNYQTHYKKWGDNFFDIHALAFQWGATHHPMRIMEIGTRTGLSIAALLSAYQDFSGLRVCLFDLFDDGLSCPDLVRKHLEHLAIPTGFVEFYIGDSRKTVPAFKQGNTDLFDYILCDGGHSVEVLTEDLENVVDLLATGGVLLVDDISATVQSDGFDLKPALNAFQDKHLNEFSWYRDEAGKGTAWAVRR
jgi:predicted O-methyltransferase YrrM